MRKIPFPVFLAKSFHQDQLGNRVFLSERRLIQQSPDDPVIAVIGAPVGSRIRTKPDMNGPDQLIVPLDRSFLGRILRVRATVPAKYIIGDAYRGAYGLRLESSSPTLTLPSEPVDS